MRRPFYPDVDFDAEFAAPRAIFRDTPFWAWNTALDDDQIRRQIAVFARMGMGGTHVHVRTGLKTPYLSPAFMDAVRTAESAGRDAGLLTYLYDEDRWPSGAAGGLVTADPAFRARYLRLTPRDHRGEERFDLRAVWHLHLDADGRLVESRLVDSPDAPVPDGWIRYFAFREIAAPSGWFNNHTYVDVLNPAATQRFIDTTHEAYRRALGEHFGTSVPSMFTDEPQIHKHVFRHPDRGEDAVFAFTDELPDAYRALHHDDFFATLPEVFWERADGKPSRARYRFHDFLAERFAASFADPLGAWCDAHHLPLTGHLMNEPTLDSQTRSTGDAMRCYRAFGLPGIDMLCAGHEYSTAKQAQSASRQYGCGGVLSELDGVTDWDWSFAEHKSHGDWQAALGVTLRVPHLSWMSMEGEAKRDYPASIHYQSPWWTQYPVVADHFARVGVAMTRGRAVCRVATIHPVESFWLAYGPQSRTADARRQAENDFVQWIDHLEFGLVDFDFVAESLLPAQFGGVDGGQFHVGAMAYDAVLVPPTTTLRATTLAALEAFADAGGTVIFAGRVARLVDVEESPRPAQLAERCTRIDFARFDLLTALEPFRELAIASSDGHPADSLLYQLREEPDGTRYLFVAETRLYGDPFPAVVTLYGDYAVDLLDTATGTARPLAARRVRGRTVFEHTFHEHGHLLARLRPADAASATGADGASIGKRADDFLHHGETPPPAAVLGAEASIRHRLEGPCPVTLDEPNVLLLDRAAWRMEGDDAFQPEEDILRLGLAVRRRLGLDAGGGREAQPYTQADAPVLARVELRFVLNIEHPVDAPFLALERPHSATLRLDDTPVPFVDAGYWTDESIRQTCLPALAAGRHVLSVTMDVTATYSPEAHFLLGDFGVRVDGRHTAVIAPVRALPWGDVTARGLPFYGGNITYHAVFDSAVDENLVFTLPRKSPGVSATWTQHAGFRGTLATVSLDGAPATPIAFAPWTASLGRVPAGRHRLDLTLYGNRFNCFGAVHIERRHIWMGPGEWRTLGDRFDYAYQLRPLGLLAEPRLCVEG